MMEYNPDIYHRKSIRLKGYDYSRDGGYFVTICTHNRELYFEFFPELKEIVSRQWHQLPERFSNLILDEFIIMPNHIHGIIIVGATLAVAPQGGRKTRPYRVAQNQNENAMPGAGARPAPTIGEIIGTFKSLCINDWLICLKEHKIDAIGKFWQRNYYEHIIRNERKLSKIREYIQNNPLEWSFDQENPDRIEADVLEGSIFK